MFIQGTPGWINIHEKSVGEFTILKKTRGKNNITSKYAEYLFGKIKYDYKKGNFS